MPTGSQTMVLRGSRRLCRTCCGLQRMLLKSLSSYAANCVPKSGRCGGQNPQHLLQWRKPSTRGCLLQRRTCSMPLTRRST